MFAIKHINKLKSKDVFIIDFKTIFTQDISSLTSVVKKKLSKITYIIGKAINNCRQQKHLSNFSLLIGLYANFNILFATRLLPFLEKNNTKAIVLGDVYHKMSEICFLSGALSKIPVVSYQYSSLYKI